MAFTFYSPANTKNIWNLCFRDRKEMANLYYRDETPDSHVDLFGITDFTTSTVYILKDLDGSMLSRILRHELTHVYLWETGQSDRIFNEEELCEVLSAASPSINKTAEKIILRLKEGLYKKGE